MSDPYDPYGQQQNPAGQPMQYGQGQNQGQGPEYGQPPTFHQMPTYYENPVSGQPGQSGPLEHTPVYNQSGYGQQQPQYDQYGQPLQYDQYGQPVPPQQPQYDQYGQPIPPGYGAPGHYAPPPQSSNVGKWIGAVCGVIVVIAVVATLVVVTNKKNPPSTPLGDQTASQSALAQTTGPAAPTTAASAPTAAATSQFSYALGECVQVSGPDTDSTITEVNCSPSNYTSTIVGIVSSNTTGSASSDEGLCLPFKYDTDFENPEHGSNVLYCLASTNGMHNLRYAVPGGCVYYTPTTGSYEMDCSNALANYDVLGVLANTTSTSGCNNFSGYNEYFTSPAQDQPPFVVCGKSR